VRSATALPAVGFRSEWRLAARRLGRNSLSVVGLAILLLWTAIALTARAVAPSDPVAVDVGHRLQAPSHAHLLGTDFYGRDVLSRILYGARYDLAIAIVAVGVAAGVGTPFGVVAGYYGGRVDDAIMRVCDVLLAFPSLVLALALGAALGPGLWKAVLAVAPMLIFGIRKLREHPGWTQIGAVLAAVEIILNRANVLLFAMTFKGPIPQIAPATYIPSLIEWGIAIAPMAATIMLFALAAKMMPMLPKGSR
jgi:hypothetical protein